MDAKSKPYNIATISGTELSSINHPLIGKVAAGKPIIAPSSQSPHPDCADDAPVLHLTARDLVPRNSSEDRQDVNGELVPLAANLGGERSGQWFALPSAYFVAFNSITTMSGALDFLTVTF